MPTVELLDFDSLDEKLSEKRKGQVTAKARSSVASAATVEPEKFAETLSISDNTGFSPDFVDRNKEEIVNRQKVRDADFQAVLNSTPAAQEWLTDPNNAKLVSDDFSLLGRTARYLTEIPESFGAGLDNTRANELSFKSAFTDLDPDELAELRALEESLKGKDFTGGSDLRTATVGLANTLPQLINQFAAGGQGAAVAGTATGLSAAGTTLLAGNAGPQAAVPEEAVTLPVAFVGGFTVGAKPGFVAGMALENFEQQFGQIYRDLNGLTNSRGERLDSNVVLGASFIAVLQTLLSTCYRFKSS